MSQRTLVFGCGSVGAAVARRLRDVGHHVTGTTTTPSRLSEVAASCDAAILLRGGDTAAVRAALDDVDQVVVTVSPPESRSMSVADRLATYRDALVATATSVVAAAGGRPVVAISSLSVHGTAEAHAFVDEGTPLPDLDDPSPRSYREMERVYLEGLPGRATLLRTGDIVSAGDPSLGRKVAMAHEHLGGSVPFDDRALAYRVTADEVAEVVLAVFDEGPQGVLHVVPVDQPPTNAELYGAACAKAGLPPLTFRRELTTPIVPVRGARVAALGVHLRGASGA